MKKFTKLLLSFALTLLLGSWVTIAFAQTDECGVGAPVLVSTEAACVTTAGTTVGATRSLADACLGGGDDDVWYRFVAANAQETITVSNVLPAAPGTAIVIQVFDACGGTSVGCVHSAPLVLTTLIEGNTYYIRVYTSVSGSPKTFDICVTHPAPPDHDECATATNLTPTAGIFTNPGAQTNAGATRSLAGASCATSNTIATVIQDVWYSLTTDADGGTLTIAVDATNVTGDPVIHLFSACATSVECTDMTGAGGIESLTYAGLPANTTYRFRVYGQNTANFPFTISLTGTAVTPVLNDECIGAFVLTSGLTCVNTTGTTFTATQSMATAACAPAAVSDDDVWYQFVAESAQETITVVRTSGGPGTAMIIEAFTACGGTSIGCVQTAAPTLVLTTLIEGNTYFFRVYSSIGGTAQTFTVCVTHPALPANDECGGAINLTPTAGIFTDQGAQTNFGATRSLAGASCTSTNTMATVVQDVWFKFTSDADGGTMTITVDATDATGDPVIHTFTGCAANVPTGSQACIDATTGGGTETITTNFIPANTEFYFRVYGQNTANFPFTVTLAGSALPLELKSFTGQVKATTNVLSWETLTEKNVQSHIVERSADGSRWSEVGRKNGLANSTVAVKYTLEDRAPLAKAYYRLRSVDFDGKENYSNTIVLTRKGEQFGITSVFPSPTKDNVTVQFNATREESVTVRVLDLTGRLVLEQTTEAVPDINELPLTLQGLQVGVYTVTVSNAAGVSAPVRFVKQ